MEVQTTICCVCIYLHNLYIVCMIIYKKLSLCINVRGLKMEIVGLDKVSLLDFPGKISAIIFTNGCNFACPYCHNSSIATKKYPLINEDEILAYLSKRAGLIDGVVISGGEPLLQNDLIDFIKKVKQMGLAVKIDTNGYMPDRLKQILDTGQVDYVAMDIKAPPENYSKVIGVKNFDINRILQSIEILKNSGIDYEFRTTFIKDYHKTSDVSKICEMIKGAKHYYIQSFKDSDDVPDHSLTSFSQSELDEILENAKKIIPTAEIK